MKVSQELSKLRLELPMTVEQWFKVLEGKVDLEWAIIAWESGKVI